MLAAFRTFREVLLDVELHRRYACFLADLPAALVSGNAFPTGCIIGSRAARRASEEARYISSPSPPLHGERTRARIEDEGASTGTVKSARASRNKSGRAERKGKRGVPLVLHENDTRLASE